MTTPAPLPTPATSQQVPLAMIPTDVASQARVKIRLGVIRAYAQAMTEQVSEGGLRFPAIVLFADGQRYWLGDGFHRVLAAREAGLGEFPAEVRPGNQRAALLHSISSNTDHGLPRTNADKRKGVNLLLADAEWSRWSDGEVARRCQVSQTFVSKLRRGASQNGAGMRPRRARRGETVYEMKVESSRGKGAGTRAPANAPKVMELPAVAVDRHGIPLPPQTAPVFASLHFFEEGEKLRDQLAELIDQLAQGPGGEAYRQHLVRRLKDGKPTSYSPELQVFGQKLSSAAPHCGYCPRCHGKHAGRIDSACKLCSGRGWLSKGEFQACPQHELQVLQRLRIQDVLGQSG